MKTTRLSLSFLVVLVAMGLIFSGCLGIGGKDQTIEEFFAEVGAAFKSLEAAKIADLWVYPIILEEAGENNPEVKMEREDFQAYVHLMFFFQLKTEGVSVEEFEITDSELAEMEIVVGGDGKTATVSNAAVYFKIVASDPDDGDEGTFEVQPFELTKVGKKWKFKGRNGILPFF